MHRGRSIHVRGIVQGVGFRPFIYGLATRYDLGGWVLNNSSGVDIEVYGAVDSINDFVNAIEAEKPPLAVIDNLETVELDTAQPEWALTKHGPAFTIRESEDQPQAFVPISPDVATCDDCLREMLDPHDRRYRYPFTNCTNCGPRFTIIRDVPYDRPLTTMSAFEMCPSCQAEYDDPSNRRFHAQPNACPECGPQLSLSGSPEHPGSFSLRKDLPLLGDAALIETQRLLDEGAVVAVKGLGGYHLACNAADDDVVRLLRERKGRVDKPYAVMATDIDVVRTFAHVSDAEEALLQSRQRPIVLLSKREDYWLSDLTAPGNHMIGVMLPYTPFHHLLLQDEPGQPADRRRHRVYVMTSGNLSEEPIVKDNEEAYTRLSSLADAFLQHDRDIYIHCDDSVVRSFRNETVFIRRARGYAPAPIGLPVEMRPILAVGGELKNTFCLTNGPYAFMSQHIGDMENLETLQAFERTVDHYRSIFRVEPESLACDMHPAYLSTRWAMEQAEKRNLPLIQVQHHHAHIAAVMAEHGLEPGERVIGLALDGTGYGADGTIWGGEILAAGYTGFQRVGRLRPVPLPGGDAAIRRPYRMALSYLWDAGIEWAAEMPPVQAASVEELRILHRQLETGLNATLTSSMGRFFDAISSIAGVRQTISYEAQAAMEFEALVEDGRQNSYDTLSVIHPLKMVDPKSPPSLHSVNPDLQFEIDSRPIVRQVANDVLNGVLPSIIATRFHQTIADVMAVCCRQVRHTTGLNKVALSGGVFQNMRLLGSILDTLQDDGFTVLTHRQLPANDGGLALGQAVVAHYRTLE